jgi:iron complex transport system substrate-binding protein
MLELAGVRVVSLYPETFEAFDPYIRKLGLLTGKTAEAERRLRQFHADLQAIHTLTQAITPKVRVYFESVARGYKTVTPDSPPARAIALAGGLNAAQDAAPVKPGSSIAAYGAERLLQQAENIDVFVAQQGMMNADVTAESIAARPGFAAIKAVAAGRVYVIDEKLISSPTFRYVRGVRQLAQWFYPQTADRLPTPDAP